jgi:hypothetical protein
MNELDLRARSRELIWGLCRYLPAGGRNKIKSLSQVSRCPGQDSNVLSQHLLGRTKENHDKSHSQSLIEIIQC